ATVSPTGRCSTAPTGHSGGTCTSWTARTGRRSSAPVTARTTRRCSTASWTGGGGRHQGTGREVARGCRAPGACGRSSGRSRTPPGPCGRSLRVPHPHGAVVAAGGQARAVGAERQAVDRGRVAPQGAQGPARFHVPELDRRVPARRRQAGAVRAERQPVD